ncbi:hypothetical protein IFM53868_08439 [Aspergillus udagawae]|uniref:Uncharacterized protein n=1 Tax=Aspergillus udagawae TaxID=91492 RepID=A0ABQ1B8R9_9EURO|nr:hypothetical protein IFM53868_08439 [Aspergillus udagawae]
MCLLNLPPELFWCIVEKLEEARHILSLATVNRQLHNELYPYLYRFNVKRQGSSAMIWAAQKENLHAIRTLLRYQANVNVRDHRGRTPIFYAICSRNETVVKALLEQKEIDIAYQDPHGYSPLNYAASTNFLFAVSMLLNKGANLNTANRHGSTPLNWAVEQGNTAMVDVLLKKLSSTPPLPSVEIEQSNSWSLHIAAGARNLDIIKRLLAHGYDVNTKDSEQQTPLSLAVRKGYLKVVNLLLCQRDIDINVADTQGMTPIWLATRYGRDEIACRLLAKPDLDVNAVVTERTVGVGREWSTSLHHAVQRGCLLIARLLLANDRLDPNITDHLLRTPLHWAASNGNIKMVNLLLSRRDVLLNAEDIDGSTPLMLAVIRDHTDVVKRLARAPRRYRQSEWS